MIKREPLSNKEYASIIDRIICKIPYDLELLYKNSNGAEAFIKEEYLLIWPLDELIELNNAYCVNDFAPDFLLIGSNGGDIAYAIEKSSGRIYQMPFIGMSRDEAELIGESLSDLYKYLETKEN